MSDHSRYRANSPDVVGAAFEPTEAFSWAFGLWRLEPQRVAMPLVALGFVLVIVGTVIPHLISGVLGWIASFAPDSILSVLLTWLARLVSGGIGLVVTAHVCSVAYPFVLNVARGRPVAFEDVLRVRPELVPMLGLVFLLALGMGVGTAVCVVPGLFCAVATSMAMPLLVDRGLEPVAALRASWQLVQAHLLAVAVFCLFCGLALLVGTALCFAGAVFVAIPVVLLGHAYVYLHLIGETPINA